MGEGVEFIAIRVMAVTIGLERFRSKLNWIFTPPFSNTVILGISGEAGDRRERGRGRDGGGGREGRRQGEKREKRHIHTHKGGVERDRKALL